MVLQFWVGERHEGSASLVSDLIVALYEAQQGQILEYSVGHHNVY